MPSFLLHAASIIQFTSVAFLGAGGMVLLLAISQPGPKSTSGTVLQFVAAAIAIVIIHVASVLQAKRGPHPTTRSSRQGWTILVLAVVTACTAIAFASASAAENLWEISHDSAPLDRPRLLLLAQPIIGIALCASMISGQLFSLFRPATATDQPNPSHPTGPSA